MTGKSKAKVDTLIVQTSLTMISHDCHNMLIVQDIGKMLLTLTNTPA